MRLLLMLAAACMLAPAQVINLNSSRNGFPQPAPAVTSITGGSNLPTGFTIYVNNPSNSFLVGANTVINWVSQGNTPTGNFLGNVISGSLITGFVPQGLFPLVSGPVTVLVSVTQNGTITSNTATFLIVPRPATLGPNLPTAVRNQPYSTQIVKDGTAPYSLGSIVGAPPAGITFNTNFTGLTGTPTGPAGLDSFQPTLVDFWNNSIVLPLNLQVVDTPDIGAVNSSAGSSYTYGTLTDLSVQLNPAANPPFAANVQFRDGVVVLGTASIVPATGIATLQAVFLSTGSHTAINAVFLGDSNWVSVTSPNSTITVTQATPTFQLLGNPFSATYGGTLSIGTISVIGAPLPALVPTGTLTLSSGPTQIATFPVNGLITLTGTQLPASLNAGVQPLTFTYSGNVNYTTANTQGSVTIAKATPTATLTVGTNPVTVGQNESLTATLKSPTTGVPGGTASFVDAAAPIAGATVNLVNGAGTFNTSALAVGAHPISVSYNGDTNFLPVTSAPTVVNVVAATLLFTTTNLPPGNISQPYQAALVAVGGVPPYTFTATGLPPGVVINPQTGVLSGTPTASGNFTPVFTATDTVNSKVTAQFTIIVSAPSIKFSPFATLPNGVVGVGYSGSVGTNGGVDPVTYSVSGGTIPPGLTFLGSGVLTGTPTTVGKYTFTIRANDATNASDSRDFTVTIQPAPLGIPGGSVSPKAISGTPFSVNFGCSGGVPPYTSSVTGTLPLGLTFANCVLSGTPTTPGVYLIHITLTDSAGATVTKDVTVTVDPPGLSLTGGALPDGQVGVAYKATITATGGLPPVTYAAGSGLPDGLSLSSAGEITGTPATAGQFTFRVTATDASKGTAPTTASATFTIIITPPTLAFGPASLPDGVVGVAYSGSLTAVGGVKPYSFTVTGLPDGLSATTAGVVSGTPTAAGTFTVSAIVRDASDGRAAQTYTVKIAPPPITIPTASAPNGTVGTAYSATFTATGGIGPYTFTSTGQPQTLTMSAGGTLSGTPTAPGTISITVTAKDSTGATVSRNFSFTIALPPSPPLNFGGIAATVGPLQQPRITVSLGTPYPVDVLATLNLASQPGSPGPPDPAVAFLTGGTTATIVIPAGSLNGATDVGIQTGSVAGTITITAKLSAAGADVTPSPAPTRVVTIAAGAPVLVSVTATRTATGFTVTIVGYVTDREMVTGNYTFNGTNLGTTSLAVPLDALFTSWFGGSQPPSAAFGGQFTYTQQFVVNGSNTAITSVAVTLANKVGTSNTITTTLN